MIFLDKIFHFFNPENWGEFGSFCCFRVYFLFGGGGVCLEFYITKLKRKTLFSTSFLKKKER